MTACRCLWYTSMGCVVFPCPEHGTMRVREMADQALPGESG